MDITPQEKIGIYKEELLARKQQAKFDVKKKVETLTQKEREEIFNEINQFPSVFVEETDITKPHRAPDGLTYIVGGIALITASFFSFYLGIAIAVVGSFLIFRMSSSVYEIKYSCPACGHQHDVPLYDEDEQNNFQKLSYTPAKCRNCSQDFNLYCESLYGNTTWKIKI
mgnify:CR=1 FL=1